MTNQSLSRRGFARWPWALLLPNNLIIFCQSSSVWISLEVLCPSCLHGDELDAMLPWPCTDPIPFPMHLAPAASFQASICDSTHSILCLQPCFSKAIQMHPFSFMGNSSVAPSCFWSPAGTFNRKDKVGEEIYSFLQQVQRISKAFHVQSPRK